MSTVALSPFAGIGFGVALERLGIVELGIENDRDVVATRAAAGMLTIADDVWSLISPRAKVSYRLLTAGPPCQTFSHVGTGTGRSDLGLIQSVVGDMVGGRYSLDWFVDFIRQFGATEGRDPRTALVLTPLAYILRDMPEAIVLEQVAPVLPVWEAYAAVLRDVGYSVATGIVNAEQYGVPQTRKRAVLVANIGAEVTLPRPTHSRYHVRRPARIDPGVQSWVSMAQALASWQEDDLIGFPRKADGRDEGVEIDGVEYRSRDLRPGDRPAWAVTGKTRSWKRWGFQTRPATTVTGHGIATRQPSGIQRTHIRAIEDGSFTLREPWDVSSARKPTYDGVSLSRSYAGEAVNITVPEGLLLQTFDPAMQVAGNRNSQWQQIGNAVPPLLAERLILAALGQDDVGYRRYA